MSARRPRAPPGPLRCGEAVRGEPSAWRSTLLLPERMTVVGRRRTVVVLSMMATRELYEPLERYSHVCCSIENLLYMRGGRTLAFESGSENARLQLANCIEKFDPYLEVWHQLNTTGTPHPGLDGCCLFVDSRN